MTAALPTTWTVPPQPDLRVALVVLHAQAGDDFFSDTALAWVAGELRQQGLTADLVHVHLPRGNHPEQEVVLQDLVRWCGDQHVGLLCVDQLWDESLLVAWQALGIRVCCLDPNAVFQEAEPDLVLAHSQTHRAPLRQLALTLQQGGDLLAVPNLRVRTAQGWLSSHEPDAPYPQQSESLLSFCPVTDPVVFGQPRNADGTVPRVRRFLDTNTGCPFSDPVARNPLFDSVDLSAPGITLKGCSFCFMGGDYRALPVAQTVAVQVQQLQFWQQHVPGLQEVVLRDQAALRYLPQLVQACLDAKVRPVGILVPGRGEAILRYGAELRRAVALAADSGLWLGIHLIGFESFSQRQLDLYNKGVTVAEYAEALRQMRALHQDFPQTFALYASGASSFVLFTPWTTLDDLQQTADFCTEHALGALAHALTLTRLRLYPNLPVYWKAKQDGLLADGPAPLDRGARYTGYSAEAPWRYAEPLVGVVEDLQRQLAALARPKESVGVLQAVLAWARQQDSVEAAAAAVPTVVAQWQTLRALWQTLGGMGQPVLPPVRQQRPATGRETVQATPKPVTARDRTVLAGAVCNNRCRTCTADHAAFLPATAADIDRAAASGQVVLSGREPTLWPELPALLQQARASQVPVTLVSNGRLLGSPQRLQRLSRSGVQHLILKRHRLLDADEDAYVQVPGAGAQTRATMHALAGQGQLRWTLLLIVVRGGEAELLALVQEAAAHGAVAVQFCIRAAEVDLSQLAERHETLVAAAAQAQALGLRVQWEGM